MCIERKRGKMGRPEDGTFSGTVCAADKAVNSTDRKLFATCISGGAADNSIDVVLGGEWNDVL